MAPIGSLHTLSGIPNIIHPKSRLAISTAAVTHQELTILSGFEFGKTNRTPEFLSKFPQGKIPSFESSDGVLVTEGNAIAYYIADIAAAPLREQLLGRNAVERAKVQQWVHWATLHLSVPSETLLRWRFGFGVYDEKAEAEKGPEFKKALDYLESQLKGRMWLLDDVREGKEGFSLADLAVSGALVAPFVVYIDEDMRKEYPNVVDWFTRMQGVEELKTLMKLDFVEKRKERPDA